MQSNEATRFHYAVDGGDHRAFSPPWGSKAQRFARQFHWFGKQEGQPGAGSIFQKNGWIVPISQQVKKCKTVEMLDPRQSQDNPQTAEPNRSTDLDDFKYSPLPLRSKAWLLLNSRIKIFLVANWGDPHTAYERFRR